MIGGIDILLLDENDQDVSERRQAAFTAIADEARKLLLLGLPSEIEERIELIRDIAMYEYDERDEHQKSSAARFLLPPNQWLSICFTGLGGDFLEREVEISDELEMNENGNLCAPISFRPLVNAPTDDVDAPELPHPTLVPIYDEEEEDTSFQNIRREIRRAGSSR